MQPYSETRSSSFVAALKNYTVNLCEDDSSMEED